MRDEFVELFEQWMHDNRLKFEYDGDDIVHIPNFGDLYIFDSGSIDKLFKGEDELELQLPIPVRELIDDEVFYAIVLWGKNFYYIDLREDVELKILKYIGDCDRKHSTDYINLGIHSPFELLNGSHLPEEWVKKAKFFGHEAVGICDQNTLAGTLVLQKACDKAGIKPIFGYSLEVRVPEVMIDGFENESSAEPHSAVKFGGKVYCLTDEGWAHMLRIQKAVMVDNHSDPHIDIEELCNRGAGNCFVFDKLSPEHLTDEIVSKIKESFDQVYFQFDLTEYKADRFDVMILEAMKLYLEKWQNTIPPVLICDNYYLDKDDARNKVVLNKIAHGTAHLQSGDQYYKHIDDHIATIRPLFSEWMNNPYGDDALYDLIEEVIENTHKIANAATARIETGKLYAPEYEQSPEEFEIYRGDNRALFLDKLEEGFEKLVPKGKEEKYRERLDDEVYVIESTNNVDYFLMTARDCINYAHDNDINTSPGRGSAGGCLVSYLLGIITIDPITYELLFERFLTPQRCGLVEQDVCVVGDDVEIGEGGDYVTVELDDGKFMDINIDSELMVMRGNEKIVVFADEIEDGDEILMDKRDEIYEIKDIAYEG